MSAAKLISSSRLLLPSTLHSPPPIPTSFFPYTHTLTTRSQTMDILIFSSVKGIDLNTTDMSGNSPLYLAVKNNHPDIVELLCRAGADVNTTGGGNNTPLHVAARHGFEECLEVHYTTVGRLH